MRTAIPYVAMVLILSCNSSPPDPPAKGGATSVGNTSRAQINLETQEGCTATGKVPGVIRFGATPYVGSSVVGRQFEPVLDYLAEHTGREFELVQVSSYEELVELLVQGDVDLVSLSPMSYVKARSALPCLRLLLTQVSSGSAYYSSYILVRADSGITSFVGLEGKRFAYTSRDSASGYLFPTAFALQQGLDPDDFLGETSFAGNHMEAVRMLLRGDVDATATFSWFMKPARAEKLDIGKLRVLAITGRIPHDAVCAHPSIPLEFSQQVADALQELNSTTERGRRILHRVIDLNGWIPTEDSVYDSVRRTMHNVSERRTL